MRNSLGLLFAIIVPTFLIGLSGCDDNSIDTDNLPIENTPVNTPVIVCDFVTPLDNAKIAVNDTLAFEVKSSYAERSVTKVEYFLDNNSIGTATDSLVFNWVPDSSSGGKHVIRAKATYDDGTEGVQRRILHVVANQPAQRLSYRVVNTFPHDAKAYTQGLLWQDGVLYESTGLKGQSSLRKVNLLDGKVLQRTDLEAHIFGEGITLFQDRFYMLSWDTNVGFIFDKFSLQKIDQFQYTGEGWGLTHNGSELVMSDGTATLRFLEPNTLQEIRHLKVIDENGEVEALNELEWINGEIWANIYRTNFIVSIDPQTGMVTRKIDFRGLLTPAQMQQVDVLNGIAWDETQQRMFVTGKLWPSLFEVMLVEP